MMRRVRIAAVVGLALAASIAAGCSHRPSHDDSYKTDIPAALEAASLGISDAYADVSLDGFTETLTVGGTVDLPAAEETKASPDFVRDVIRVALDGRVLNMRYLDLAFRDTDNQKIDVKSALTRLGGAPSYDGTSITMDEARTISEGGGTMTAADQLVEIDGGVRKKQAALARRLAQRLHDTRVNLFEATA